MAGGGGGTETRTTIRWLPPLVLLALATLWGANPSFSKALALQGVSPLGVVFWMTLMAGLVLSAICALRRTPIRLDRKSLAYYVVIGSLGLGLAYVTLVHVVGEISAGFAAVIILLSPLLTYFFAVLVRLERLRPLRLAGIAIGFAGAGILVFPEGSLPAPGLLPVALLALIIPGAYAMSNVYAEWGRPKNADNVALAAGTMLGAALGAGAAGLIHGSFYPIWLEFGQAGWILMGYALSTAMAYLLFYWIIAAAGAVYLGQVGYMVTLTGVGWSVVIHGETTSVWLWLAVAVVFAGVALVNFGKGGGKRKTAQPRPAATAETSD